MHKKITLRDRKGAVEKLAKAKLTDRQLDALEEVILYDAINRAERDVCTEDGKRAYLIRGTGSVLSFSDIQLSLRVALRGYYDGHLMAIPEKDRYPLPSKWLSLWRPKKKS